MRNIRRLALIVLALLIVAQPITAVQAQTYDFQVPKEDVTVYVNADGSLSLDYYITFSNSSSGDPIDIVDIGMPNYSYSIGSMTADIDGQTLSDIRDSEYVHPGVEVHLDNSAIASGKTGTLHLYVGQVDYALGKGTQEESESYASLEFMPNYFDGSFVSGNTALTVSFVLPAGMTSEEPRYYTPQGNWPGSDQPTSYIDDQGRVVYTWTTLDASPSAEYTFGAAFPMRLVPSEVVVATETPNTRSFNIDDVMGFVCCGGFVGFFILIIYLANLNAKKRKLQYLPPKISVEGHGIKRGLTPVEVAVLMQTPLDRVMTMVLFSVLKKEAAIVESQNPLKLKISDPLPEGLQPYEVLFLKAFRAASDKERKEDLQDMTVKLIKSITEKMRGFSRKETIDYYKSIMEKAWSQVETAGTPEVKAETYEQVMDWTMLDDSWDTRTQRTFNTGPVIVPSWWWRYDPVIRSAGPSIGMARPHGDISVPSSSSSGGGTITMPKLPGSDFAASVVGGVEAFSSNVMGGLTNFTDKITNTTNPPPPPSSSGGHSSGGGSSCACACACAGCACACAGGGR
ncbi:MAG TPA: hypothetical protein PKD23_05500 [Bellilinea sp.]|nr:hypothetical protein [Bellilinea sp.]